MTEPNDPNSFPIPSDAGTLGELVDAMRSAVEDGLVGATATTHGIGGDRTVKAVRERLGAHLRSSELLYQRLLDSLDRAAELLKADAERAPRALGAVAYLEARRPGDEDSFARVLPMWFPDEKSRTIMRGWVTWFPELVADLVNPVHHRFEVGEHDALRALAAELAPMMGRAIDERSARGMVADALTVASDANLRHLSRAADRRAVAELSACGTGRTRRALRRWAVWADGLGHGDLVADVAGTASRWSGEGHAGRLHILAEELTRLMQVPDCTVGEYRAALMDAIDAAVREHPRAGEE